MEKNKTAKYFKYAIGEIILVVIGILIALQINTWNEGNKRIQKGQEILLDIRDNTVSNTVQFKEDVEISKDVINSIDIILENISVTKVYNDSLDPHFRFITFWVTASWKSTGYKALVAQGTDIVQSKKLRESIIDLYETSYPLLEESTRLAEGVWTNILPDWLELIVRETTDFNNHNEIKARPFDYNKILDSRLFRSALTHFRSNRLDDINIRISTIEKNQELIELIDKELLK